MAEIKSDTDKLSMKKLKSDLNNFWLEWVSYILFYSVLLINFIYYSQKRS